MFKVHYLVTEKILVFLLQKQLNKCSDCVGNTFDDAKYFTEVGKNVKWVLLLLVIIHIKLVS